MLIWYTNPVGLGVSGASNLLYANPIRCSPYHLFHTILRSPPYIAGALSIAIRLGLLEAEGIVLSPSVVARNIERQSFQKLTAWLQLVRYRQDTQRIYHQETLQGQGDGHRVDFLIGAPSGDKDLENQHTMRAFRSPYGS